MFTDGDVPDPVRDAGGLAMKGIPRRLLTSPSPGATFGRRGRGHRFSALKPDNWEGNGHEGTKVGAHRRRGGDADGRVEYGVGARVRRAGVALHRPVRD